MTEKEFTKQVWTPGEKVILDDGDVYRVIGVHFGVKTIKVALENGGSEWVDCDRILKRCNPKADSEDVAKELKQLKAENVRLMEQNEMLKIKLKSTVREALVNLGNLRNQAQTKLINVAQTTESILSKCEKIDDSLEHLRELLKVEDGF